MGETVGSHGRGLEDVSNFLSDASYGKGDQNARSY